MAKYAFGSEKISGFVQAGPSFGYGLNGKTKGENNGNKEEEDIEFGEDGLKRFDFSLAFGAGIGFPVSSGQLFIDLRYLLGLANISKSSDPDAGTLKNRGLNFGVGFLVPINN